MRISKRLLASLVSVGALLTIAGAVPVFAGSNGQVLSMYDYTGVVNSATVHGFNQNCLLVTDTIDNWPQHWFNTAPSDQAHNWYWQEWKTCGSNPITVTGYYGTNLQNGQVPNSPFTISLVPHSQSISNWTSCQVDPTQSPDCVAGYETRP